jgi:protein subunit release factor A
MEEISAYEEKIERVKKLLASAETKREQRRYRNLKNKANRGFKILDAVAEHQKGSITIEKIANVLMEDSNA